MPRLWITLVCTALASSAPLACSKTCVDDGLHGKQSGAACLAMTTTEVDTTAPSTTAVTTSDPLETSDTYITFTSGDCSCATTGELTGTSQSLPGTSSSDPSDSTGEDLCQNGDLDPGETDLNCGGPDCPPCVGPLMCQVNADCATGLCPAGICVPPECVNGVYDPGIEWYLDCGGMCGRSCRLGFPCQFNTDCVEGAECYNGACVLDESCANKSGDPGETDFDCGGPICGSSCKHTQNCIDDSDCVAGTCSGGCKVLHCMNNQLDPGELDTDCGGECGRCDPGQACIFDSDCDDSSCVGYVCTV